MTETSTEIEECPACNSNSIIYWESLDAWVCDDCSYVIDEGNELESKTPDLSADSNEEKTKNLNWEESISVKDKSEANLVEVVSQVEEVADDLSLSNELSIRAVEIVVEAWKTNFMHGRTMPDTVGASIYAASREFQQSIPPAIIVDRIESDKASVKKTYRHLKSDQELDIDPPSPKEFVNRICKELNLPQRIEKTSVDILDKHHPRGNPIGIAGAGIYKAANNEEEEITLREVAEVTGLTKETIWRHTSEIGSE
ncbi:MAG: hypothetical protein ABEJ83_04785 [Candidatus Nanohaloarchaea archaeon]